MRPRPFGYYFGKRSERYLDASDCPGNVTVVVSTPGIDERPALARAVAAREDVLISPDLVAAAVDAWDLVKGIIVSVEEGPRGCEIAAWGARFLMSAHGVPMRPIISYTANAFRPILMPSVDVVGVQCYPTVGIPLFLLDLLTERRFQHLRNLGRKGAAIWGGFDRRKRRDGTGALTIKKLLTWQRYLSMYIDRFDDVLEDILVFSYRRPGGCEDHPELLAPHREILGAMEAAS